VDGLTDHDLRGVFAFIDEAWSLAGERAFTMGTLEALRALIPCDFVGYADLDRVANRTYEYVGDDDENDDDTPFWDIVDDHPLCHHQQAYGDFSATRLSDVISRRRLLSSRIYAEWYRPAGITAELDAGITPSRARTRNFVLSRADGDFSVRDRTLLEMVRPHLARIHEMAQLRQSGPQAPDELDRLTHREREVLELLATGLSNAAIAERLWISTGTVKKHLDNIYAKLGVAGRTQAAGKLFPTQGQLPRVARDVA
jgi:DNA-binding CsgD family transcriptional regulator